MKKKHIVRMQIDAYHKLMKLQNFSFSVFIGFNFIFRSTPKKIICTYPAMFPLVVYNMLASILHRIESLSFPQSMHTRGCSMVRWWHPQPKP